MNKRSIYSTTHKIFQSDAFRCTHLLFLTLPCHQSPLFSIAEGCASEWNGGRASAFGKVYGLYCTLGYIVSGVGLWIISECMPTLVQEMLRFIINVQKWLQFTLHWYTMSYYVQVCNKNVIKNICWNYMVCFFYTHVNLCFFNV